MNLSDRFRELFRIGDRDPEFEAVAPAESTEEKSALDKIARREGETDEPQTVVGITRGKNRGMDVVTTANGREISRRAYRG